MRAYHCLTAATAAVWLFVSACAPKNVPAGGQCASTEECVTGLVCAANRCSALLTLPPVSHGAPSDSGGGGGAAPLTVAIDLPATTTAYVGEVLTFAATASDAGATLAWQAKLGDATVDLGTSDVALFSAEAPGSYVISVTASRGDETALATVGVTLVAERIFAALEVEKPVGAQAATRGLFAVDTAGRAIDVVDQSAPLEALSHGYIKLGPAGVLYPSMTSTGTYSVRSQIGGEARAWAKLDPIDPGGGAAPPNSTGHPQPTTPSYRHPLRFQSDRSGRYAAFQVVISGSLVDETFAYSAEQGNQGGDIYVIDTQSPPSASNPRVIASDGLPCCPTPCNTNGLLFTGFSFADDPSKLLVECVDGDGGSVLAIVDLDDTSKPTLIPTTSHQRHSRPRLGVDDRVIFTGVDQLESSADPAHRAVAALVITAPDFGAGGEPTVIEDFADPDFVELWPSKQSPSKAAEVCKDAVANHHKLGAGVTYHIDYALSPDGSKLVVVQNGAITMNISCDAMSAVVRAHAVYLYDLKTGARRDLLAATPVPMHGTIDVSSPQFAADGKQIVFFAQERTVGFGNYQTNGPMAAYRVNVDADHPNTRQIIGGDALAGLGIIQGRTPSCSGAGAPWWWLLAPVLRRRVARRLNAGL